MTRRLIALAMVTALVAVPVRAEDGLMYLAGHTTDMQIDASRLRDRLKDFLDRASVAAPVARSASQAVTTPMPEPQSPAEERAETIETVPAAAASRTPDTVLPAPEALPSPREVMVAALQSHTDALPVPAYNAAVAEPEPVENWRPGLEQAKLELGLSHPDMPALDLPAAPVLPSPRQVMVAALQVHDELLPPVLHPDTVAQQTVLEIDFRLPAAQATIDGIQLAYAHEPGRDLVFDNREEALAALGLTPVADALPPESMIPLQPPTPYAELLNKSYDPNADNRLNLDGDAARPVQLASADPIPLVPPQYRAVSTSAGTTGVSADETSPAASETLVDAPVVPRPRPKPQNVGLQTAALTPPPTQAISIDGRGVPLSIQTGKGRMLRLPEDVDAIFVAEPAIADIQIKSPRMVYLFGKLPGETTIYAVTKDETVVLNQRIQVAHNLDPLNELIQAIHPEALVDIQSLNNTIVLTGLVPDISTAEDIYQLAGQVLGEGGRIMNRIKVAGANQVNLRVRVAEVDRQISKQLGFDWDVLRQTGSLAIGFATIGAGSVTSATTNVVTGSLSSGNWDVNSVIDALDNEGLITVLAEPNLTAMNGEVANFLAGGEFPIPIAQGDDTISITFKQFGVSLSFSPQTLDAGRINIKVITEVSQLSDAGAVQFTGFAIPALTTRRAETTVELRSGQSFAIAGLLQNVTNQAVEDFPGLADLPIIGPLFKSERFRTNETELLIVVTPYLVRPANTQLALPTDGYVAPTDAERFLGQRNRPRVPNANAAPQDRNGRSGDVGEAGFIVR